jgi:hypothetical protein
MIVVFARIFQNIPNYVAQSGYQSRSRPAFWHKGVSQLPAGSLEIWILKGAERAQSSFAYPRRKRNVMIKKSLSDSACSDCLIDRDSTQSELVLAIGFESRMRLPVEALSAQGSQRLSDRDKLFKSALDDSLELGFEPLFARGQRNGVGDRLGIQGLECEAHFGDWLAS